MADENWLQKSLWEAHISVLSRNTPIEVAKMTGHPVSIPVPQRDADEIYRRMARHFYAWTGQELRHYAPATQGKPQGIPAGKEG